MLNPGVEHPHRGVTFISDGRALRCRLPSGRCLVYQQPSVERVEKFGRERNELWFWGEDSQTKQWRPISTYGGKLVENIVQAVARDILAHALPKLEAAGYPAIFTVCAIPTRSTDVHAACAPAVSVRAPSAPISLRTCVL